MKILLCSMLLISISTVCAAAQQSCPRIPPSPQAPLANPPKKNPPAPELSVVRGDGENPTLVFLGDSLTAGDGASAPDKRFPYVVAHSFDKPRAFESYARGGLTSTTIADLFQHIPVPEESVVIIWIGRNNTERPDVIVNDVTRAVSHISGRRFIVLSVLHALYDTAMPGGADFAKFKKINDALSAAFPENFLAVGLDLVCADRKDNTHPNDNGYSKVAHQVAAELKKRNW
ncbi:SGNH/GDSL hydrolase family protein [Rhizobium sp. RU36D]|uniref:SGNH/GDSL hydrolase family protein n=1 Tax=Rhizobium sp. RU36D TaxID=1907415 RepID=UPI0009D8D00A|nr:SGNH/GDSL hydrolase family protein [Rhizobium sp. RU36D]SMD20710.1 Lysophospholipase L1 [Rhizobium sp. RU36D]